jgi:hypothetical protein
MSRSVGGGPGGCATTPYARPTNTPKPKADTNTRRVAIRFASATGPGGEPTRRDPRRQVTTANLKLG